MTLEAKIERFKAEAVKLSEVMRQRLGADFFAGEGDAEIGLIDDAQLGQMVAFDIDGELYSLADGDLVVQRERGGRVEWTLIDENGNRGAWRRQPPSRGRAGLN